MAKWWTARGSKARWPHHVGDAIILTVNHLGQLKQLSATLAQNPHVDYKLKPMDSPTEPQQEIYRSYLNIH